MLGVTISKVRTALLLFFLANISGYAQSSKSTEREPFRSAGSSAYVGHGDGAYVTDNRLFEFANVLRDDGAEDINLLLLKTLHNERLDGREEMLGRVTVQAWTLLGSDKRETRWHFEAEGNAAEALQDRRFFRVTKWGCCDWPHVKWFYSLLSGKRLYVSNGDLLEISAPNGGPQAARYVSFGYHTHGAEPLLQYGSDSRVQQIFALLSPRTYYDPPRVVLKVGNDQATEDTVLNPPFSFVIVLGYADGLEIQVPVENDVIRPDRAILPQGYALRQERVN